MSESIFGWEVGNTGYASIVFPSPDFLANCTLDISSTPIYWYSAQMKSNANLYSTMLLKNSKTFPMSLYEMNQAMLRQMDYATALMMK